MKKFQFSKIFIDIRSKNIEKIPKKIKSGVLKFFNGQIDN